MMKGKRCTKTIIPYMDTLLSKTTQKHKPSPAAASYLRIDAQVSSPIHSHLMLHQTTAELQTRERNTVHKNR